MSSQAKSTIYLDISVLIAMVCPEKETESLKHWYRSSATAALVTSPWIRTELASALSFKVRTKQLTEPDMPVAWQIARRLLLTVRAEPIQNEDFDLAAQLCSQAALKLRGPDALHLAVAKRMGCTQLATIDQLMGQAAQTIGIEPFEYQPQTGTP